jgi:transcriptional regulator with XRE-family HTH domain
MKPAAHDFSKTLSRLMVEHGMTVKRAAEIAGVGSSKIQAWRSGTKPTDFEAVRRLAEAMGTTMAFLLTGRDDAIRGPIPAVSEVLADGGLIFDGICQVVIRRLVPTQAGSTHTSPVETKK